MFIKFHHLKKLELGRNYENIKNMFLKPPTREFLSITFECLDTKS